jgi:hypothetical protein
MPDQRLQKCRAAYEPVPVLTERDRVDAVIAAILRGWRPWRVSLAERRASAAIASPPRKSLTRSPRRSRTTMPTLALVRELSIASTANRGALMARKLHPALARRAVAVKQAHAHLAKTVPGFTQMAGPARLKAVHAHIGPSAGAYLAKGPKGCK